LIVSSWLRQLVQFCEEVMSSSTFNQGDRVWVSHPEYSWLSGFITSVDANVGVIVDTTEAGKITVKPSDLPMLESCGSHVDQSIENLVDLDEMSEGAILHHVRKRYHAKDIYTHVGNILVAVNPFEALNIYDQSFVKKHLAGSTTAPHVYGSGAMAYKQLVTNQKNQAVLISGESGAGKTETTKKVLSFLASAASRKDQNVANGPGIEEKNTSIESIVGGSRKCENTSKR